MFKLLTVYIHMTQRNENIKKTLYPTTDLEIKEKLEADQESIKKVHEIHKETSLRNC